MTLCTLYFITDAACTAVKIGLTRRDPSLRLRDLQAGSPVVLVLAHIEIDVEPSKEIALHQHFAHHWRHREWFDYTDEIKGLVAALAAGDRGALDMVPPAPFPKGYRTEDGWLVSNEDTLRYIRDGVSVLPL
jgi:hypothetical protein